jgi:hypothetical protein
MRIFVILFEAPDETSGEYLAAIQGVQTGDL